MLRRFSEVAWALGFIVLGTLIAFMVVRTIGMALAVRGPILHRFAPDGWA